jgi:hypothetical protein
VQKWRNNVSYEQLNENSHTNLWVQFTTKNNFLLCNISFCLNNNDECRKFQRSICQNPSLKFHGQSTYRPIRSIPLARNATDSKLRSNKNYIDRPNVIKIIQREKASFFCIFFYQINKNWFCSPPKKPLKKTVESGKKEYIKFYCFVWLSIQFFALNCLKTTQFAMCAKQKLCTFCSMLWTTLAHAKTVINIDPTFAIRVCLTCIHAFQVLLST